MGYVLSNLLDINFTHCSIGGRSCEQTCIMANYELCPLTKNVSFDDDISLHSAAILCSIPIRLSFIILVLFKSNFNLG